MQKTLCLVLFSLGLVASQSTSDKLGSVVATATATVADAVTITTSADSAVIPSSSLACNPFSPSDSMCGFLSPAKSVFTLNQAASLNSSYAPALALLCPNIKTYVSTLPVVFCLGSLGPCNQANFTLPDVDSNGIPKNISSVATFYNEARFEQVFVIF